MRAFKIVFYLLFIITFSNCEKKYRWSPSECAPKHYPAKILSNNYQYKNGGGVGTSQRTAGGSGWGNKGAGYAVGERLKPVPDSLFVNWFSVTEGKFYKGRFKLSDKSIEKKLKKGQIFIYTCFAPHGRVVVYVSGEHGKNPIDKFRAIEDTSMTPQKFLLNATNTKNKIEYEKKYGHKLYTNNEIMMDYMSKEDRIYIAKHGIPDKW